MATASPPHAQAARRPGPARVEHHRGDGVPAAAVRIQMFRVGLGDAFLLTFQPGTSDEACVLVDLGSIGQSAAGVSMAEVVDQIAQVAHEGKLRAVVATHEHADHISGFPQLARAGVHADEAWLAWTENPEDKLAEKICKYQGDLCAITALALAKVDEAREQAAIDHPAAARGPDESPGYLDELAAGVREVVRFSQEEPPAAAARAGLKVGLNARMRAVSELADRTRYWSPGTVFERPWAPGVRFYVLGPPRSEAAIQDLGRHGSPDLYELAMGLHLQPQELKFDSLDGNTLTGEELSALEPFDREYQFPRAPPGPQALGAVVEAYETEDWRQIDPLTLGAAAELALQLDSYTNNTSLVLAVEVGEHVLILGADAQQGSCETWPEVSFTVHENGRHRVVTGKDLLRRATFYKVGHHGSHNGTTLSVLELTEAANLTAFISLDDEVAKNKKWTMPAPKLLARLEEKTHGRVVRSDHPEQAHLADVTVTDTYVQLELPLQAEHARTARKGERPQARA